MLTGKPPEVFACGFVAIGQDYVDGFIKELHDVELLMLIADPEKGESYPWGAQGRFHKDYEVNRGRVGKKKDGFNSTFTDPYHEKLWDNIRTGKSEYGDKHKFRMKKVMVTLRISDVEANALGATRGYLSEILTGMHEVILTISPRSKQPIVHRTGQHECIIIEDSEWKDFVYPPEFQQCEGITQAGTRCTAKTKKGEFCKQHTPKGDEAGQVKEKELVTS